MNVLILSCLLSWGGNWWGSGVPCTPDTIIDTLIDTVEVEVLIDLPDTVCLVFPIFQMAEICSLYNTETVTGNCENNYHVGLQDTLSDTNVCRLLIEPSTVLCSREEETISEVLSATLWLYAITAPAAPTDSIYAYTIDADWVADECDWTNRMTDSTWTTGGGDGTYIGGVEIMPTDSGWFSIDITNVLSAWMAGAYGIMLRSGEGTFFDYVIFQHPSMCGCDYCPYIEAEIVLGGAPL